jgi:hypothetical protein
VGSGLQPISSRGDLYDVLMNGVAAEAVARETAVKNLHVLPASTVLAAAEVEMVAVPRRSLS